MNKSKMLGMIITIIAAAPTMFIDQPVIAQNMTGKNATSVNATGVVVSGTSVIFNTSEECVTYLTDKPPQSASGIALAS